MKRRETGWNKGSDSGILQRNVTLRRFLAAAVLMLGVVAADEPPAPVKYVGAVLG